MKHRLLLSFATLILSTGLSQTAFGDVINNFVLTLSNPNQVTSPGAVLTYSGTIKNTSTSTIFLNGIEFNDPAYSSLDSNPTCAGRAPCTDELPFFTNTPVSLSANTSFTGILFNVTVPVSSAISSFSGFVDIIGGSDPVTNIGTSNIVGFSTTVTPEPSSWLLLATGLAGLAIAYRFRAQTEPAMTRL